MFKILRDYRVTNDNDYIKAQSGFFLVSGILLLDLEKEQTCKLDDIGLTFKFIVNAPDRL